MEFKTLKDLCWDEEQWLKIKREALKIYKARRCICAQEWREFFNITEKEMKEAEEEK